jgi:hypothetical protein
MRRSAKSDAERTSRIQIAALAALGVALLAAAAVGTYQASLARAHAVREAAPEGAPSVVQYLPGSSSQIGTLREPLMAARRAALRAGFDRDEAPIDAFDRLRSIPGHDEEARSLLAQFWDRKAMLADDPVRRVLYALQARVVDDDDGRRRTADSAIAALGPLRIARHVAEGTILSSDARTLVLQGSGWVRVFDLETQTSFDLPETDAGSSLVDAHRMVTWGYDMARVWDLDAGATSPVTSFKLLAGEAPLTFSGDCVLTSDGRVWHVGDGEPVTVARGQWLAGSVNPTCDRIVLRGRLGGEGIASFRRRGKAWTGGYVRTLGKGAKGSPIRFSRVESCAAHAPRCVLRDTTGAAAVWDLGPSPPRRLDAGVDCDATRFSPNGTRFMCRESQDGVSFYSEGAAGHWTRTDVMLPPLNGPFLQDDGAIAGSVPWKDPTAIDRSDVLFLDAQPCWAPAAVERTWGAIRMLPNGSGAVFTFPATGQGAPGNTEFFGFDSTGESLAGVSNAWFGGRRDERLLERDTTDSAAEKTYELAGAPFDPALALGEWGYVSSLQIDQAFFVPTPVPSLIIEIDFVSGSPWEPSRRLRAVARWDLQGKHFCGPAIAGALTGIGPSGEAAVIDGRIDRIGLCASDRGFEPTDVTGVQAVAPSAARWIARDGESLLLEGPRREPSVVSRADRDGEPQIAFSPNGAQFLVKTSKSLCNWLIRDDGQVDLDGCRWSTGGWASDAAWAAADKSGETAVVFDRTAEGAALRQLFGSQEARAPTAAGDLACNAVPGPGAPALAVLRQWEERLGHRFKDQATSLHDATERVSSEIVPTDTSAR